MVIEKEWGYLKVSYKKLSLIPLALWDDLKTIPWRKHKILKCKNDGDT